MFLSIGLLFLLFYRAFIASFTVYRDTFLIIITSWFIVKFQLMMFKKP